MRSDGRIASDVHIYVDEREKDLAFKEKEATEPGLWLKTPLVNGQTPRWVTYLTTGRSVSVTLIPIEGPNPNHLQHYFQFQVILKPSPDNIQELYLNSLEAIGIDTQKHNFRFVEDDWEPPTLSAWGLGWEVWCDSMQVTQFTYFQQVGGFDCKPVAGEITYGLERLAMYIQGVKNVYDLNYNGKEGAEKVTYSDVFLRNEQEQSAYCLEHANTKVLLRHFKDAEAECHALLGKGLALPAYDQCIIALHTFNLLDSRGAIGVTKRAAYIGRICALAKGSCEVYLGADAEDGTTEEEAV